MSIFRDNSQEYCSPLNYLKMFKTPKSAKILKNMGSDFSQQFHSPQKSKIESVRILQSDFISKSIDTPFKTTDMKMKNSPSKITPVTVKKLPTSQFPMTPNLDRPKSFQCARMYSVFENLLTPQKDKTKIENQRYCNSEKLLKMPTSPNKQLYSKSKVSIMNKAFTTTSKNNHQQVNVITIIDTDPTKIIIKGSDKIKLKKLKDETDDQRNYTKMVGLYKSEKEKEPRRPPPINYSLLLNSINGKIAELNNKQYRYNLIRRRMKGFPDRCIWNIDTIINRVDQYYFASSKKKSEEKNKVHPLEEMQAGEIRGMIKQEIELKKSNKSPKKSSEKCLIQKARKTWTVLVKFQNRVKNCIETIKKDYKVSIKEWNEGKILSMIPYAKEHSKKFFSAIKIKDNKIVTELLDLNPYLIYDIDSVFLTLYQKIDVSNRIAYSSKNKQ